LIETKVCEWKELAHTNNKNKKKKKKKIKNKKKKNKKKRRINNWPIYECHGRRKVFECWL